MTTADISLKKEGRATHGGVPVRKWLLSLLLAFIGVLFTLSAYASSVPYDANLTAYDPVTAIDIDVTAIVPETDNAAFPDVKLNLYAEKITGLPEGACYLRVNEKWVKVTPTANEINISAYLNKAQTFAVAAAMAESDTVDEATAAVFPYTAGRPAEISKASVNYEICKDDTAQTPGGWTVADSSSSIALNDASTGKILLVLQASQVTSVKDLTFKEGTTAWKVFPASGITVAAPRTAPVSYVVRLAPNKINGVLTPASVAKLVKPASQVAMKKIKIDYKKEVVKLGNKYTVIVGQTINDDLSNFTPFAKSGFSVGAVLDAASSSETRGEAAAAFAYWQSATAKKPASVVSYFGTSAAAAKLFPNGVLPEKASAQMMMTRAPAVTYMDFSHNGKKWKVSKGIQAKATPEANWTNCKTPVDGTYVRKAATKENAAGVMAYILVDADSNEVAVFPSKPNDIIAKVSLENPGKHVSSIDTPKWDDVVDDGNGTNTFIPVTQKVYVTYIGIPAAKMPDPSDPTLDLDKLLPVPAVSFENADSYTDLTAPTITAVRETGTSNVFSFELPAFIPPSSLDTAKMIITMGSDWSYSLDATDPAETVYTPAKSVAVQEIKLKVPPLNVNKGTVAYGIGTDRAPVTDNSTFAPMTLYTGLDYTIDLSGEEHPYFEGNVLTIPLEGLDPADAKLVPSTQVPTAMENILSDNALDIDKISLTVTGDPASLTTPYTIDIEENAFKVTFDTSDPYAKNKYTFTIKAGSDLAKKYRINFKPFDVYVEVFETDSYLNNDGVKVNPDAFTLSDTPDDRFIDSAVGAAPVDANGAKINWSSEYFGVDAVGTYARYTDPTGTALTNLPAHMGTIVVTGTETDSFVINERIAKLLVDAGSTRKSVYYQILGEALTLKELPAKVENFDISKDPASTWKTLTPVKGIFGGIINPALKDQERVKYGDIIYIAVVSEHGEQAIVYSFNVVSEQTAVKPNEVVIKNNFAIKDGSTVQYPAMVGTGASSSTITATQLGVLPIAADAGVATVSNFDLQITTYDPNAVVSVSTDGGTGYTVMTPNNLDARVKTTKITTPLTVDTNTLAATATDFVLIKIESSAVDSVSSLPKEWYYKLAVMSDAFVMDSLKVNAGSTPATAITATLAQGVTDISLLEGYDPVNNPSAYGKIVLTKGRYTDSSLKLFIDGYFRGRNITIDDTTIVPELAIEYAVEASSALPASLTFAPYYAFSGVQVSTDDVLFLKIGTGADAMYYAFTFESSDAAIGNDTWGNQSALGVYPVVRGKGAARLAVAGVTGATSVQIGEINIGADTIVTGLFDAKTTDSRATVKCAVADATTGLTSFTADSISVTAKSGQYVGVQVTPSNGSATSAAYYVYQVVSNTTNLDYDTTYITNADVDKVNVTVAADKNEVSKYTAYTNALQAYADSDVAVSHTTNLYNSLLASFKSADKTYTAEVSDLNSAAKEKNKWAAKVTALTTDASDSPSNSANIALAKAIISLEDATVKYNTAHTEYNNAEAAFLKYGDALYGGTAITPADWTSGELDAKAEVAVPTGASVSTYGDGALGSKNAAELAVATLNGAVATAKGQYNTAVGLTSARESVAEARNAVDRIGEINIKEGYPAQISVKAADLVKTDPKATVELNVTGLDSGWGTPVTAEAGSRVFAKVTSTSNVVRYYTFMVYSSDGGLSPSGNAFNGTQIDPVMIAKDTLPNSYGEIFIAGTNKFTGTLSLQPNTIKSTLEYVTIPAVDATALANVAALEDYFTGTVAGVAANPTPISILSGTTNKNVTVQVTAGEYLFIKSTPPVNPLATAPAYYYGFIIKSDDATPGNSNGTPVNYLRVGMPGNTEHAITSFGEAKTGATGVTDIKAETDTTKMGRIVLKGGLLNIAGATVHITPNVPGSSVGFSLDGVDWKSSGTVDLDVEVNKYLYVAITSSDRKNTEYYKLLVSSSSTALFTGDGGGSAFGEVNIIDALATDGVYKAVFTETDNMGYNVKGSKTLALVFGDANYKDSGATYTVKSVEPKLYTGRTTATTISFGTPTNKDVSNIWFGDKVVVTVTASDGVTKQDYVILVADPNPTDERNTDAARTILESAPGSHKPVVGPNSANKIVEVGNPETGYNPTTFAAGIGGSTITFAKPGRLSFDFTNSIQITFATVDKNAIVRYSWEALTSSWVDNGTALAIPTGTNAIYVEVTSSGSTDGGTKNTINYYKFNLVSSSTTLDSASTAGTATIGGIHPNYTATLTGTLGDIGSVTLTLKASDGSAQTYKVKNVSQKPYGGREGSLNASIDVGDTLGTNNIVLDNVWEGDKVVITVTAADGVTQKDVTLIIG